MRLLTPLTIVVALLTGAAFDSDDANGIMAIENGRHTGALAGKVLLKTAPAAAARAPSTEERGRQAPRDREAFSTNILEAQPAADIRNMEDEIAFIRRKANSVLENARGYWEAHFDHGIIMIYLPAGTFVMGNDQLHAGVSGSAAAQSASICRDRRRVNRFMI